MTEHEPVDPSATSADPYVEDQLAGVAARTCPYYGGTGTCNQGCYMEPGCLEFGPPDDISAIEDRWLQGWQPGDSSDERSVISALCREVRVRRSDIDYLNHQIRDVTAQR